MLLFVGMGACGGARAPRVGSGLIRPPAADSIVLERGPCFGSCPVYRLRIGRRGMVAYEATNRGDRNSVSDTVGASSLDAAIAFADSTGFRALPDTIFGDPRYCASYATDLPSIALAIFGPDPKHVNYYTGCTPAPSDTGARRDLGNLEHLATLVDSLAGVDRWITPH